MPIMKYSSLSYVLYLSITYPLYKCCKIKNEILYLHIQMYSAILIILCKYRGKKQNK